MPRAIKNPDISLGLVTIPVQLFTATSSQGVAFHLLHERCGSRIQVYFEDTYYLGAGKNGERGYRVLVQAMQKTHRVAIGSFTWRGKTTPIAIRVHQEGLLLQRLYFAGEVHDAAEVDRGADPKIRDQERTLAERLISELSGTELRRRTTRTTTGSGS
jgi:non-homologous end joining protein Ku